MSLFHIALLAAVIAMMLVFAGVCVLVWSAERVRRHGRRERPAPADVAIILGAYTHGMNPSRPLRLRLRAGLDLYRSGLVSYFIVSGGQGANETVTESRSMKRFLVLNNVPPERIIEEHWSTDTWENLVNSQRVMREHDFQHAVIVTSDYHLPRALAVAKQLGIQATGYAAWSSRGEFRFALREVLARILYTLRGQAALVRKGST